MRRAEIEALGELAGDALAGGGTLVRELHEGIAARPFGALGPAAAPVRVVHDGISRAVYAGVSQGLRAAARGSARVVAARAREQGPPLGSRVRSSVAIGALNGVYGSRLRDGIRLDMQIRRRGVAVPLASDAVAAAFPDATSRIVVFVHGLCETEAAWYVRTRRRDGSRRRNYGERLQDELSFTPVYVRYNTGLPVQENGRALSRSLEALVAAWPVGVEELVLVGHSAGGLVSRSACLHAEGAGLRWAVAVRHVVCLGNPRLSNGLEKGTQALSGTLARLPETRPVARLMDSRSAGLKDLRSRAAIAAETDFILGDRCHEVAGVTHFELLNHPAIYRELRARLSRGGVRWQDGEPG